MVRDFLNRANKPVILAIGIVLISLVVLTDYITYNLSFSIFYLIPIVFVTWYTGSKYGLIFSFGSAVLWYLVDYSNRTYSVDGAILFWNAIVRFGFFTIITLLLAKLKLLQINLETKVRDRTADLENEISDHKIAKAELTRISTQLRELNKKIETIKEDQNTRIAREVHDELGQALTAINLEVLWIGKKYSSNIDIVNRMLMLSEIVSNTIGTVRKISSDLRPRLLDQLGLVSAMESQLKDFSIRSGVKFKFNASDNFYLNNNNNSITIFRILQEALTNISRHSNARNIDISICNTANNNIEMHIKDDGKGFNVNRVLKNSNSLGLIGMKERAAILNGNLEINSSSLGTEILLKIPN